MSEKPVVHLNQTDVDLMYRWAGVQCRMDNDHGGTSELKQAQLSSFALSEVSSRKRVEVSASGIP